MKLNRILPAIMMVIALHGEGMSMEATRQLILGYCPGAGPAVSVLGLTVDQQLLLQEMFNTTNGLVTRERYQDAFGNNSGWTGVIFDSYFGIGEDPVFVELDSNVSAVNFPVEIGSSACVQVQGLSHPRAQAFVKRLTTLHGMYRRLQQASAPDFACLASILLPDSQNPVSGDDIAGLTPPFGKELIIAGHLREAYEKRNSALPDSPFPPHPGSRPTVFRSTPTGNSELPEDERGMVLFLISSLAGHIDAPFQGLAAFDERFRNWRSVCSPIVQEFITSFRRQPHEAHISGGILIFRIPVQETSVFLKVTGLSPDRISPLVQMLHQGILAKTHLWTVTAPERQFVFHLTETLALKRCDARNTINYATFEPLFEKCAADAKDHFKLAVWGARPTGDDWVVVAQPAQILPHRKTRRASVPTLQPHRPAVFPSSTP
ncbi:MAG: hypothetical protein LBJ92_00500 [Holosporales bacterium]|jgi:hypothetical protein|nr:hypothetical protein [Holosporales bacterium]